jgi:hypothetical protein
MQMYVKTIFFSVFLHFAVATVSRAQNTDNPVPSILEAWKIKQNKFESIRYKFEGTLELKEIVKFPAITYDDSKLPKLPITFKLEGGLLLDLKKHRYRHTSQHHGFDNISNIFNLRETTEFYNGKSIFYQQKDSSEISIGRGKLDTMCIHQTILPIYFSHGFVGTTKVRLGPDTMPLNLAEEDLVFESYVYPNKKKCYSIKTDPSFTGSYDSLIVSNDMTNSIVRQTYQVAGNIVTDLIIDYVEKQDFWFVNKWSLNTYRNGKLSNIIKYNITQVEIDPKIADSDFEIAVDRGMTVNEFHRTEPKPGINNLLPNQITYTIDKTGVKTVLQTKGYTKSDGSVLPYEPTDKTNGYIWWFGLLFLAISILLLIKFCRLKMMRSI